MAGDELMGDRLVDREREKTQGGKSPLLLLFYLVGLLGYSIFTYCLLVFLFLSPLRSLDTVASCIGVKGDWLLWEGEGRLEREEGQADIRLSTREIRSCRDRSHCSCCCYCCCCLTRPANRLILHHIVTITGTWKRSPNPVQQRCAGSYTIRFSPPSIVSPPPPTWRAE